MLSRHDTTWHEARCVPPLRDGALHVWRVPIDIRPAEAAALCDIVLDAGEQGRARRFVRDQRRLFVAARAALRILLAHCVGGLAPDPQSIALGYAASGKRYLADHAAGLQFSVSHVEAMALFAFSACGATGVDVERVDERLDVDAIGTRVLTPFECTRMESSNQNKREFFFSCWTRKEAQLKMTGGGLNVDCRRVEVYPEACTSRDEQRPYVRAIAMLAPFVAAVACEREPISFACWSGAYLLTRSGRLVPL